MEGKSESVIQKQTEKEYASITAKQLQRLLYCKKSFEYDQCGIIYNTFRVKRFVKNTVIRTLKYLSTSDDYESYVYSLFDNGYDRDWFSSDIQHEVLKKRDRQQVIRLVTYVVNQGYSVLASNGYDEYDIETEISCKGYVFHHIQGRFDFLLKKGEQIKAIILKCGEPTYSSRARKKENLSENAVELLAAYIGSFQNYNRNSYSVEMWYLKNKDDTSAVVMEQFEHRTGKNIVSADYSTLTYEQLVKRFNEVLAYDYCSDCSNCIHKGICQVSMQLHTDKIVSPCVTADKNTEKKTDTEDQKKVINFTNGQMCVVAVPGAGKTYSLTKRTIALIKKGVHPSKILLLTFTNKAAKEILSRVTVELKKEGITGEPLVTTFNGFGYSILKENPMYLGKRIKLATEIDRYSLINKALNSCTKIEGVSYDALEAEYGLIRTLDRLFTELDENGKEIFCGRYKERKDVDGIFRVYDCYKSLYEKCGYISFDEQISLVNEIFDKYPVLAKRYAEKYEYIMADEFQDSNEEQVEMLYTIVRHHGNLVVVGDDDQSVYGWRKGSSKYMLEFKKDFPNSQTLYMEDNFRSQAGILEASNALIVDNGKRYSKIIKPHKDGAGKPVIVKGVDGQYLKKIINSALMHGYKAGEIAILARNNNRLAEVQQILEGFVPLTSPKDYMVDDAVFLAIYDIFTLYFKGMSDDVALYRLCSFMGENNELYKENRRESFYENLLQQQLLYPINVGEPECVQRYEDSKKSDGLFKVGKSIVRSFEAIYSEKIEIVLKTIISNVFSVKSHPVVDNLIDDANMRGLVRVKDLYELMSDMLLYGSKERVGYGVSIDAVNLLTAHDSKGKEFKNVIIFGAEDFSEEEEEVRVLYVAMTRAINNLFLVETAENRYDTLKKILPYVRVVGGSK